MQDDRQQIHVIEIIPPGAKPGEERNAFREATSAQTIRQPSPLLRTTILVAALAAGMGLLALLVVFAATVALVAVPAAIVAGIAAWVGLRWRSWRGGTGR
ncbi:hypothetical protein [Elioraea rosea]|uniref:hypothetical protein n=1 Tax=Elioraea rosea TaxID=2492390 RepID=UPI001181F9A2|nr:hypothetical protein [Elioraea rosea]